jgi:hypothetical protein
MPPPVLIGKNDAVLAVFHDAAAEPVQVIVLNGEDSMLGPLESLMQELCEILYKAKNLAFNPPPHGGRGLRGGGQHEQRAVIRKKLSHFHPDIPPQGEGDFIESRLNY